MGKITNKVVKIKKIQKTGPNLTVILPKGWLNEMGWNRLTKLAMEFLPHRRTIILSEVNLKDSVTEKLVKHVDLDLLSLDTNEEVSDIVQVSD